IFEDDATLILFSCSAGREGGIAQELSDLLNITVIASEEYGYTERCDVKIDSRGRLDFSLECASDGKRVDIREYRPGDEREMVQVDLTQEGRSEYPGLIPFAFLGEFEDS